MCAVDSVSLYKECVEMAAFHGTDGSLQRKTPTPCGLHKEGVLAKLIIHFFFFKNKLFCRSLFFNFLYFFKVSYMPNVKFKS